MISCGGNSTADNDRDAREYYPVQLEDDGKWGMIGGDGKLLFSDEFKNPPTVVVNGFFSVKEGDGFTLYEASTKPKSVNGCEQLYSVGVMMDGVIPVTKKSCRITLVNRSGKTVATLLPVNGKEIIKIAPKASDGLFLIKTEENKYGFVNTSGKIVIEPKYEAATTFSDGYALAVNKKNRIIIDKKGKKVGELKKDLYPVQEGGFKHGLMACQEKENYRYGFINTKGEYTRCPSKVKGIIDWNSDYFVFINEDFEYGCMDMNGDILIRAKYSDMAILPDGRLLARDTNKALIIDKDDKEILSWEDYSLVEPIDGRGFYLLAKEGSHCVFLNSKGQLATKEEFRNVVTFASHGNWVTSDYFNSPAAIHDLLDGISPKGLGKYQFGLKINSLGLNPDEYLYESTIYDENLNKEGWHYSKTAKIFTTTSIARREYDNYYSSKAVLDPYCEINGLSIEMNVPDKKWFNENKGTIIKELEKKGFSINKDSDSDSDPIKFSSSSSTLFLYGSNDDNVRIQIWAKNTSFVDEILSGPDSLACDVVEVAVPDVAW